MAEEKPELVRLRAELAEQRGLVAERDRLIVGLSDQVMALVERNAGLAEQNRVLAERVAELERRLGRNPRNSHLPPSCERYQKPPPTSRRTRSGRRPGGQPGSAGGTLSQVAAPDEVVVYRPGRCGGCHRSLRRAPVSSTETRQVADLPEIRLRWIEHCIEHRRCRCGTVTMAGAADGVPQVARAPVQYGPTVRSVATYLVAGHFLPLDRAAEVLSDLLAAPVSPGSVHRWLAVAADRLAPFVTLVRDQLAAAEVVHFDETGLRVDGRLGWVHSASTATVSLFTAHPKRGLAALEAAGVLPAMSGIAVHDGWKPYQHYPLTHALCNAHHLRELTAVAEQPEQTWASAMADLLLSAHQLVADAAAAGKTALEATVLADLHARYTQTLAVGRSVNPTPTNGGRRRTPAHNLSDRLELHRDDVLRFTTDFRVPFSNNQAEQDIRMVKIRQKISGCLRSWPGAHAFCTLRSYLSTATKQHQPALAALRSLFDGRPWLPATGMT